MAVSSRHGHLIFSADLYRRDSADFLASNLPPLWKIHLLFFARIFQG